MAAGMAPRSPRAKRPSRSSTAPRRWPAFVAGAVCGLGVAWVVGRVDLPTLRGKAPEPVAQVESPATDTAPTARRPRFEFYTLLPELEVVVPEPPPPRPATPPAPPPDGIAALPSTPAPPEPGPPTGAPAAGEAYMLQVGSFQRAGDAERLKASLALIGLQASVQRVTIDGEQTWHRVRLGPYTDPARLDAARARLREHDYQAMVLRIRG
jgi:cell division protein FtsN